MDIRFIKMANGVIDQAIAKRPGKVAAEGAFYRFSAGGKIRH
jgi:hypothetical protein